MSKDKINNVYYEDLKYNKTLSINSLDKEMNDTSSEIKPEPENGSTNANLNLDIIKPKIYSSGSIPKDQISVIPTTYSYKDVYYLNPWAANPYKPAYDYESIDNYNEILKILAKDNLYRTSHSVRDKIIKTEDHYYIMVELPGYDHSNIKVFKKGSSIEIEITASKKEDFDFDDEQVFVDNTLKINDTIKYQIPDDVNSDPILLFFKNGLLTMKFKLIKDRELLDVEDREPNLLKDAVEEMTKEIK